MPSLQTTAALTVGKIARRLGQPVWRIEYLIRTHHLKPVSRAGNARVFAESDVDRVARELRRIDARREGVGRG